jgi:hypothetical protein
MPDLDQAQPTIRRYLLGRLDDDGRERFEEQFVRDAEFRETALIVEEELIDDYLAGLLPADERIRFDAHYLMGPRQRQELTMAQAIRKYALESPEVVPPVMPKPTGRRLLDFLTGRGWLPAVVFAALLLVAVLGSWFWGARIWQGGEPELVNAAAIARLNKPPYSTEPALSISLAEFHNRAGGQGQKFSVPVGIEIVQLQLALPATPYQSYQATLRVTDGGELFTVSDLGAQQTEAGRILNLRLPARILTPRDYTLSVSGRTTAGGDEGVADYSFRVLK